MQALLFKLEKGSGLLYLIHNGLSHGKIQLVLMNPNRTQARAPKQYSDKKGGVIQKMWHDYCELEKKANSNIKRLGHRKIPIKMRQTTQRIFQEMSRAKIVCIHRKFKSRRQKQSARFLRTRSNN